jgi:hypothetical protein
MRKVAKNSQQKLKYAPPLQPKSLIKLLYCTLLWLKPKSTAVLLNASHGL